MSLEYCRHVKEQRSPCIIEASSVPRHGERLSRKPRTQNVKFLRDEALGGFLCDVPEWRLTIVGEIGFLRLGVKLGGEHAPAPKFCIAMRKPPMTEKRSMNVNVGFFGPGKGIVPNGRPFDSLVFPVLLFMSLLIASPCSLCG